MIKQTLVLLLFISVALAVVIKTPLQKHTSTNFSASRFSSKNRLQRHGSRLSKGSTSLADYVDSLYMFNVTVGTPGRQFQVILMVIVTNHITEFGGKWKKDKYDPALSSTSKLVNGDFHYNFDEVYGDLYSDVLSFDDNLKIDSQTFGSAYMLLDYYGYFPLDGVLGFGWQGLSQNPDTYVLQNIIPKLDAPVFTIWLDRHVKAPEGQKGGLLTLGGVDSTNCDSSITYVSLDTETYWQFSVDGFQMGSHVNKKQNQPLILGPQNDVDYILRMAGAAYDETTGLNLIDCSANPPDLVFTLSGTQLTVAANELIIDANLPNIKQCAFMVDYSAFDDNVDWVLGVPFLRTYCAIHDFSGKIGFAKAHHSEI
ncbi:Eukaryotic aspartyl protease [Aphelenchoides bicaudatus]|nr:Eukaryotic aspartyl protease [Aphelenchoides bicaudatus]